MGRWAKRLRLYCYVWDVCQKVHSSLLSHWILLHERLANSSFSLLFCPLSIPVPFFSTCASLNSHSFLYPSSFSSWHSHALSLSPHMCSVLLDISGEIVRSPASHCVISLSLNVPQAAQSEKMDCEKSQVSEKQCLTVRWALSALWPILQHAKKAGKMTLKWAKQCSLSAYWFEASWHPMFAFVFGVEL